MKYEKTVILKDGRECLLVNCDAGHAADVLSVLGKTHRQTDYMLTYPDENTFTLEQEKEFLQGRAEATDEIEIIAYIDGKAVGTAGISRAGKYDKLKHRAEFGIGIDKEYWNLGIGRALTRACAECAKAAGYLQLELDVVSENTAAVSLYKSEGFVEFGRNPLGFKTRDNTFQELILMRLKF